MEDKDKLIFHLLTNILGRNLLFHVVEIHSFMLKDLGRCIYHGSKPAYSFPMLIKWYKGKLPFHESLYIASFGQSIIVFNGNP
jgi:hypothetical protein